MEMGGKEIKVWGRIFELRK